MVSPLATVVIPNFNGMRFLPRLMESLAAQSEPRWTAIVVDDASTDESAAYLRKRRPGVRALQNERNLGFAASCNAGMRAADTPFVVLLNNDTHVHRDWLAEGLRPLADPAVGAVASLVLLAEPPHLIDTAGDVYSVVGGAMKRGHLQPKEAAGGFGPTAFSASGASAFYRREVLETVGYLDERFESYYEDVDLGFRLAWAGYRCVFAPRSICYHHLSSSYDPRGWRYHFNSARNAGIVWWSYVPPRIRRRYFFAHLFFLILQAGNKLRQGSLLPYLAGKWEAARSFARVHEKREDLQRFSRATETEIEALLIEDWWRLHVGSRFGGEQSWDRRA